MLRRYVHGPNTGADTPLVWYEGPAMDQASARMLNTDLQGSVTSVTDFNGNPVAINRYDEYGIPQSSNTGRFQYTGQAWLPEIGLYYYKARIYSPTLGRFMQTDPIGYADGVNWYNYVGGDPVNAVDPTGLYKFVCKEDTVQVGDYPLGEVCSWLPEPGDNLYTQAYLDAFTNAGREMSLEGIDCSNLTQGQIDFMGQQFSASQGTAQNLKVSPVLLVGLAAHESAWGTSRNHLTRNNPFGATPRGDATAGLRYRSYSHAWSAWQGEWGARIAGVGGDSNRFVNLLTEDNRYQPGRSDSRGMYNPLVAPLGDPNWKSKIQSSISSVKKRLLSLGAGCPIS